MTISVKNHENHLMSFMANNLAVKFCDVIHDWLTEDELSLCVSSDAYPDDFCDSNMAMGEAWDRMFQDEFDLSSEADVDLWNAAWNLAKSKNFNANK